MKTILSALSILIFYSISYSQIKATTEEGESVILYEDGTWVYEENGDSSNHEIAINPNTFEKGNKSNLLLKSKINKFGFHVNTAKWELRNKKTFNQDSEFELKLKAGDAYSMIISEEMEIPIETLEDIAIQQAQSVAKDFKLVTEEYRMVNGIKVLHLEMKGEIEGIKFTYFGYYYSNSTGTVQFVTFSSEPLIKKYKADCEELLNGLVELK